MPSFPFVPTGDLILVALDETVSQDSAVGKWTTNGEVVAQGPGRVITVPGSSREPVYHPMPCQVGDKVVLRYNYRDHGTYYLVIHDRMYYLMPAEHVLLVRR